MQRVALPQRLQLSHSLSSRPSCTQAHAHARCDASAFPLNTDAYGSMCNALNSVPRPFTFAASMFGPAPRLLELWLSRFLVVVLYAHTAAGNGSLHKIDAAVVGLSKMAEPFPICHCVTHRRSLHNMALTAVATERIVLNNNNKSGVAEATPLKLLTPTERTMVSPYAVSTPLPAAGPAPLRLSPSVFTSPLPSRFRAVFEGGGRGGWQRAAHQPRDGSWTDLILSPLQHPLLHELRGQRRMQIRRKELLCVRRHVLRRLRARGPPVDPTRWLPSGIVARPNEDQQRHGDELHGRLL
jgi:hypothetical protein